MKHLILTLSGLLAWATPGFAQDNAATEFGRLFHSAERRSTLDRQRQLNIREVRSLEGESLRLDGVVLRSSGKRTAWINGRPQHESEDLLTGIGVKTQPRTPGAAAVTVGDEGRNTLKVGETINRSTGERNTGLGGGAVSVRP